MNLSYTKKSLIILIFLFINIVYPNIKNNPLSGDYYIPKGSYPQGFNSLEEALQTLDTYGQNGPVTFIIDGNLNENGANLMLTKSIYDPTKLLTIKPNANKKPVITISNCSALSGANQYAGLTFRNSNFVNIDGSNSGTNSRDLTIVMDDYTNGKIALNFWGKASVISIKNLNIKFKQINHAENGTYGIFFNGQSSGAADSVIIENCQVGDSTNPPNIGISVVGISPAPLPTIYANKVHIIKNTIFGKMRLLNTYYLNEQYNYSNISDNHFIGSKPPLVQNTIWGVLFNTYSGRIDFSRNILQTLKDSSTSYYGIYGIGTINGDNYCELNIFNNFLGGDFQHMGTGSPMTFEVISIQEGGKYPYVRIYYNTIVLNALTKPGSSSNSVIRFWRAPVDIKNNIIINMNNVSTAFGIRASDTLSQFSSDNNNLYVTGENAFIGEFKQPRKTLNDWKTATNRDSNSISVSVPFVSQLDFHIPAGTISLIKNGAKPIIWITDDIDKETRNTTKPDIGADEFIGSRPDTVVYDTMDVNFNTGWNILSVPLLANNMNGSSLFPTASSSFYQYSNGYQTVTNLENGKGYWAKFNSSGFSKIIGRKIQSNQIPVNAGWNIIGPFNKTIQTSNITSNPPNIIQSNFFEFNNGYLNVNTLTPGKGYWIKVSQDGYLTLQD